VVEERKPSVRRYGFGKPNGGWPRDRAPTCVKLKKSGGRENGPGLNLGHTVVFLPTKGLEGEGKKGLWPGAFPTGPCPKPTVPPSEEGSKKAIMKTPRKKNGGKLGAKIFPNPNGPESLPGTFKKKGIKILGEPCGKKNRKL